MKSFRSITVILLIIGINTLNAQDYMLTGLIPDSNQYKDIGLTNPVAKIVSGGSPFRRDELRLRAGDTYDYFYGSNQILLSFYKSRLYTHAIKSRHNSEDNADNAIDFYVWDHDTDDSSSIGSKLVMSLNGGNVGIGTPHPKTKLHLYNDSSEVGLKLQNKINAFDLQLVDMGNGSRSRFYHDNDLKMELCPDCDGPRVSSLIICENLEIPYNYSTFKLSFSEGINYFKNGSYKFRIRETGDATFDGKITAREIEVKANVWADDVFSEDYRIKSIQEVEEYISEYKHLPDVPSESEVSENGINIGEMNAILLMKIEELTLYLIEQEKRIELLENRLKEWE